MTIDFDKIIDRRRTGSYKWDSDGHQSTLPMWVADMDFKVADCITQSLQKRLEHPIYGYAIAPESLIQTIVDRIKSNHNWVIKKEWIVWLPGLETSFALASKCIHSDSAKVMYLSPIYPPFFTGPRAAKKVTVKFNITLNNDNEWELDFEKLETVLAGDPEIKTLLFCNPHNPVGKVYKEDEIKKLIHLCNKYKVMLCSDEIHCDLILNGEAHISAAAIDKTIEQNSITLMGASKTFNIAGLGCGYAIIPNDQLRQSFKINMRGNTSMINPFGYLATETAYRKAEEWRIALISYLNANLDFLANEISLMPGCEMVKPEASFLAWVNCKETGIENPSSYFKSYGVDFSPGEQYGSPGWVRINFGCPLSTLKTGLAKMKNAIEEHHSL